MTPRAVARLVFAGAMLAAAPAAVAADGGAAAAQPQEKKKKAQKKPASPAPVRPSPTPTPTAAPARTFTDDDLKKYSEERAGAPAEGSSGTVGTADEPAGEAADQAHGGRQLWATRAREARENVAEAEAEVVALEQRIADLRNDRGAANAMDPFRLQTIQAEIQKATVALEAARGRVSARRTALDAILEDARRQGVPAGWVREP